MAPGTPLTARGFTTRDGVSVWSLVKKVCLGSFSLTTPFLDERQRRLLASSMVEVLGARVASGTFRASLSWSGVGPVQQAYLMPAGVLPNSPLGGVDVQVEQVIETLLGRVDLG
jgi:hypothetical protein